MAHVQLDQLLKLHNAEALRKLFQHLGYIPRYQTTYTAHTLQWPDNVAVELGARVFELLADVDDGVFQVLLLQPGGLKPKLQHRLYRTLEDRLSEALLVLPNEHWDLFDLVLLVDSRTPEHRERNEPIQFARFNFDPRALRPHQQRALELMDVHDVAGIEVGQRLLRAFGRAQQETLFRSQGFFSSYYLEQRIESDPVVQAEWAALLPQMAQLGTAIDGALQGVIESQKRRDAEDS